MRHAHVHPPRPALAACMAAVLAAAGLAPGARAQGCVTELAAVDPNGVPAGAESRTSLLSADGRTVAFMSRGPYLLPFSPGAAANPHVYARDLATGALERVSVNDAGQDADRPSFLPAMSADARVVAFRSTALNLAAGFVIHPCIYVRDRAAGTTVRASQTTGGSIANQASDFPAVSADGRFVSFSSGATNLVAGDTNARYDVFVHDLATRTTTRISVATGGAQGDGASNRSAISGDGRFVAFESDATTLVAGDTNGRTDVFLHDRNTGISQRVSVDTAGAQGDGAASAPSISADGRYVAFASAATNLVAGDANGARDVFVRDVVAGTTRLVSVTPLGAPGQGASDVPTLATNGLFVAFRSLAADLVAGDTNGFEDVFVRDLVHDVTTRVSVDSSGGQVSNSFAAGAPAVSDAGDVAAFESWSDELAPGGAPDAFEVFVRNCVPPPFSVYCTSSAAVCPCGNAGAPGAGCDNSQVTYGARLVGSGTASIAADGVRFDVDGMTANASHLYLQGTDRVAGGAGSPFGDGLRCAGGSVVRLATRQASAGTSAFGAGIAGDPSIAARGGVPPAGGVRHYQVWYRDPATYCTSAGFNLSNGLTVLWGT